MGGLRTTRFRWPVAVMAAGAALLAASASERTGDSWWAPGSDLPLPAYVEYENSLGRIGLVNTAGNECGIETAPVIGLIWAR